LVKATQLNTCFPLLLSICGSRICFALSIQKHHQSCHDSVVITPDSPKPPFSSKPSRTFRAGPRTGKISCRYGRSGRSARTLVNGTALPSRPLPNQCAILCLKSAQPSGCMTFHRLTSYIQCTLECSLSLLAVGKLCSIVGAVRVIKS
jgi:hypothetical protein